MARKPVDPVAIARTRRGEQSAAAMRPRDRYDPYLRPGWQMARRVKLIVHPLCECCGAAPAREVHHRNVNPWDNAWHNLASLCSACHARTTLRHRGGRRQPALSYR